MDIYDLNLLIDFVICVIGFLTIVGLVTYVGMKLQEWFLS